jgi:hypothetical protein
VAEKLGHCDLWFWLIMVYVNRATNVSNLGLWQGNQGFMNPAELVSSSRCTETRGNNGKI